MIRAVGFGHVFLAFRAGSEAAVGVVLRYIEVEVSDGASGGPFQADVREGERAVKSGLSGRNQSGEDVRHTGTAKVDAPQ